MKQKTHHAIITANTHLKHIPLTEPMRGCHIKIKWILYCRLFLEANCLFAQEPELVLPVGHTSPVIAVAYSNDGKYIVTASWDNTAKVWDAKEGRLLSELKGHTASLTAALFSPDGKFIITASKDSTARLWQVSNSHLLFALRGHKDWISSACFSADGKYIATASWDNTAKTWDAANGKLIHTLRGHTGPVNSVSISPDGKFIITASKDSTARLWRSADGYLLKTIKGHKDWINVAQFSPDKKYILTASKDGSFAIWETVTGHLFKKLSAHRAGINTAMFSADGHYIVTASRDSTAAIWHFPDGKPLSVLKGHQAEVNTAIFSRDGKYVITASKDHEARIWQVKDGQLINVLKAHEGSVSSLACSSDGKFVVTGSDDNTAKLWRLPEGDLFAELKGHTSVVTSAVFSPDGKYFVTASWDNTAKIWDAANGRLLADLKGHHDWINSVAFSPDGKYVITASTDNTARIWEVPGGKLLNELNSHTDWVSSATYSPDGKYILTTSWDNTAKLWNAASGKLMYDLQGHTGVIKSAGFSPDGKFIVTGSWDNTIKIWNAANGSLAHTLKGHTEKIRSAVFSPDGKFVLTSSWDSTAKVWKTDDGSLLYTLKKHNGALNSAGFSPDGKYIITTSMDNTVRLWTADNGQPAYNLQGHTKPVVSAVYSPDGNYIVTASWDNTARVWEAASGKLLSELRGHTASLKSAAWSPDGKYIITTSEDNTLKKWNALTGEFLYTFFPVNSTDWLAIDKESRYDGTEAARKMLYYVCNNEIINLEQYKNLSWEPNLVSKLMGINNEPITAKKISAINLCNYTPLIEEKGFSNGNYQYEIMPRQGGVGEVQLYVNNKLVEQYNPSQLQRINTAFKLSVPREKIAGYFIPGTPNEVLVKATTFNGTIFSRGASVSVSADKKQAADPDMFIISVGVSKYKNEKLQLHYASKDALDFSNTLDNAARKLLNANGTQHVYSYAFNTETGSSRWPAKAALQKLVDSIAQKAKPEDIVVIFFAGHGVLLNGQKNFLLLTADASSLDLNGVETEVSISTEELQGWLRKIKANKQILILDACNSGQVVQQFQQLIKRDVPADQKRALESLKDKTGTFILSASAAGQAAYEDIQYDQGLLTYSLLFGIKFGGGLKDSRYIDITRWFNFAADNVRTLARDIGGRQDPQILGNASFTVGLVDKTVTDSIRLSMQKKIFSRSRFIQDEELLNDELDLSSMVDKELNDLSGKGKESPLLFAADNNFQEAYSVRGRYSINNKMVTSRISLFKGQKERVAQFEITGTTDKKEIIARKIVGEVQDYFSNKLNK